MTNSGIVYAERKSSLLPCDACEEFSQTKLARWFSPSFTCTSASGRSSLHHVAVSEISHTVSVVSKNNRPSGPRCFRASELLRPAASAITV
jgi:hypothetical protein